MRIEVVGLDTINQQARTYAEYRVFAALTQFADTETVRRARVGTAPAGPWSRLRPRRLQRDG